MQLRGEECVSEGQNLAISLLFSLLAGNLGGDWLEKDCALRQQVLTAEKFRSLYAEIREQCPYFAITPRQTGLRRTDCSASNAALWRLFSGWHMCSPVSNRVSGECNAIKSCGFGDSELTFASTVEPR